MKKKFGLFALCLSLMLAACGSPAPEPEPEEDEDEIVIELSDKKVEIQAGEETEVEIENYDDLSKVKVKVEDEDIAECDIDDEIITITGISEGKTKVIVSAKGAEDVSITVKVTEPDEPVIVTPAVFFPETSRYKYRFIMDENVWYNMLDSDPLYRELADFLGGLQIGINFYLDFYNDTETSGTAVMSYDVNAFGVDFVDALADEDNFREFVSVLMAAEGYDYYDDSMYEAVVEMKDELIETLSDEITGEMQNSNNTYDLKWSIDGNVLTLDMGGNDVYSMPVDENDGSFTLYISNEEIGDNPVFYKDLAMEFHPER